MSEPPPPTGPPAGWYPDPDGGPGHRWWDGAAWTTAVGGPGVVDPAVATPPAPGPTTGPNGEPLVPVPAVDPTVDRHGPIGPIDRLLSETFRLAASRAGHLLPFVLLFMVVIGLASSAALWLGLRDTVLTFDDELATFEVDYGGSGAALTTYLALIPVSLLGAAVVRVASTRQAWLAQSGGSETWSQSLTAVAGRLRPILGGTLARWAVYLVIGGGFLVVAALVPAFVLTFPLVGLALLLAWVRLAFVDQAAVLGPDGVKPLRTSYRTSARQPGRLFVRLLVLALMSLAVILVISLMGSFITALAGAEGTTPLDPDDEVFALNDALGDNLALFVLSAVFGSLALGGATVLVAVGATLLYRNLEGPTGVQVVPGGGELGDAGAIDPRTHTPADESAWP